MACTINEYTKTHKIVCFKWVNFILYFNKAVFFKEIKFWMCIDIVKFFLHFCLSDYTFM